MILAAVGGGAVVKVLDIFYVEARRRDDKTAAATSFVDEHLDPLLKAADELVGKLLSLGKEDFVSFSRLPRNPLQDPDFASTTFLVARFWAQIEILRQQALYVSISQDERGRRLQIFLDTLEARQVRLIDRISQRAAGETLIVDDSPSTLRYVAFMRAAADPEGDVGRWLEPLTSLLRRANGTASRQQLLQYAIVLHAMIDTLDPEHSVTRDRPGMVDGKLTKRTWQHLRYRVFKVYLTFVEAPEKYIGRPRRPGGRRKGEAAR
ncbi:hypothetical protein [Phenylobacterium sp.]|uniref:hypothetical protein n=1 Tax=Phenylobacterium sp. TaxID=1871053 RepID=UPI0025FECFAD|nr:hypothetical protein [Phenylobacterium sp.]